MTRRGPGGSSGVLAGALRRSRPASVRRGGQRRRECGSLGSVIARRAIPWAGLRYALPQGCWRNGHQRPVLKHGPRSRLRMRVFGCQTPTRNESERR
jgi:hypothetical protein